MVKLKIYIAGKITGLEKEVYTKAFEDAEKLIKAMGHEPLNPVKIVPENLPYDDQMHLCFALVDISDAVMMLENWVDSPGATKELIRGATQEKKILYYDEQKDLYGTLKGNAHNDDFADALSYALNTIFIGKEVPDSITRHYEMGFDMGKALREESEHSKQNIRNRIWITSAPPLSDMMAKIIHDINRKELHLFHY